MSFLPPLTTRYEVHHGVAIDDSALVAAAALSDRYINERFLPDKAIDLIDEAAAKLKMDATSRPQELDEVSRRLLQVRGRGAARRGAMQSALRAGASHGWRPHLARSRLTSPDLAARRCRWSRSR